MKSSFIFIFKLLGIFLIFGGTIDAQIFSGKIVNDKKQPIPRALVNVYSSDEEMVSYSSSNADGDFSIELKKGQYKVVVQSLGQQKTEFPILINKDLHQDITLSSNQEERIEEVIISAVKPIKIKSDTIEYNAKSFKNGTERNVEDLLKKLPGIAVDENGKIKINGKEIEKVMVENDDFFEKGYSLLTQNMSVKPIDKVQVLDHYSNNKLLKGIEKSDKVVINLTLEEDAKAEWFGELKISNSVFPNDYYDDKLSLAQFGKKFKYFFIARANSVGKDNTGDLQHLINPSVLSEPGFIDISESLYTFDSDFIPSLLLDTDRFKFNKDQLVSNNAIFRLGKKMKLKLINISNFEKNTLQNYTETSYNLGDEYFQNREQRTNNFKKNLYFNKIEYDYEISPKSSLKYNALFTLWNSNNKNYSDLNSLLSTTNSQTKNHLFDTNLLHTYKFRKRYVLLTGLRYYDQSISNHMYSNQFFFQDLFDQSTIPDYFSQQTNNSLQYFGFINQLILRNKRDDVWDFSMLYNQSSQNFQNRMNIEADNTYGNDFNTRNKDFNFNIKYTFKIDKVNFNAQLETHQLTYESSKEDQRIWYFNPKFGLNFTPHYKGRIDFSMFLNNSQNSLYNLIPNYFSDSPRSLIRGRESEIFSKNMGSSFRYQYGIVSDKFTFSINGSFVDYFKYQSYQYTIKPLYIINDLYYFDDKKSWNLSAEINYYLKFIKSNLKLNIAHSESDYEEIIEPIGLRKIKAKYNSIGLELQSGWRGKVNYSFGSILRFRNIESTVVSKINNQKAYARFNYNFSKKAFVELDYNYFSFGEFFSSTNAYHFLNSRLSYNYSDNIQFSLLGNNLTNTNSFNEKSISSYSTFSSQTKLFNRNIMLEFIYSFGK